MVRLTDGEKEWIDRLQKVLDDMPPQIYLSVGECYGEDEDGEPSWDHVVPALCIRKSVQSCVYHDMEVAIPCRFI